MPSKAAPSINGAASSSRIAIAARRELAICRGISQAAAASATPVARCRNSSADMRSSRPDAETKAAQDRVANPSWREIAEAHPKHQRPREMDAAPPVIDAALDVAGGFVTAGEERRRTLPAIGHRRRKEPRADDGHPDTVAHEARPKRLGVSAQPRLAGAIAGAVGQTAKCRHRGDCDDASAPALAQARDERRDRIDGTGQVCGELAFGQGERLARAVGVGAGRGTRSKEHTSELDSDSFISYAVLCLNKK